MRFLALMFLTSIFVTKGNAQDSPVSIPAIASAFQVPEDSVRLTDKTEEVVRRNGENIISALLVDCADDRFPSIQILVTKGRFLLSEELQDRLSKESSAVVTTILPDGSPAYISVEGVGPGGEGHVGLANLKALDLDLKVKVTIKNDDPRMGKLSEGGFRKVLDSGDLLNAAISSVMVSASDALSKSSGKIAAPDKTAPPQIAPSSHVEENVPETSDIKDALKNDALAKKVVSGSKQSNVIWVLAIGVVLLVIVSRKIFFNKKL